MADETALESQELTVYGDRSELRLEAGRIVVHKEATTQATPTEVVITVDRVRGATLEAPPRRGLGWLHLSVVGGSPPPPTSLAAAGDPYTLPVTSRGASAARRLVRMVERHVRKRGLPPDLGGAIGTSSGVVLNPGGAPSPKSPYATAGAAPPPSPHPSAPASDPAEGDADLVGRLRELAELHEAGALTDEEFQRAKERLLA